MTKKKVGLRPEKKQRGAQTRKKPKPSSEYWLSPPKTMKLRRSTLSFAAQPVMPLKEAMVHLTRDFDWDAFHREQDDAHPMKDGKVRIVNTAFSRLPLPNAYGWYHKGMSAALSAGKIDDFFSVTTDEDHVNIAERYAEGVLRVSDIADALYFRQQRKGGAARFVNSTDRQWESSCVPFSFRI